MDKGCRYCGSSLKLLRSDARFCSTKCRVYSSRAKLPIELSSRARWVRHSSKRPITVAGFPASSTNSATWSSLDAVKASKAGDGIGFVLGAGIACIDIDHCLTDGRPNKLAADALARTPGAYVEVSPSGTGLHIWGTAPELPGRVRDGIEAYSTGRYITVTGNVFRHGTLVDLSSFF